MDRTKAEILPKLIDFYVNGLLSIRKACARVGIHKSTGTKWLREEKIHIRTPSETTKLSAVGRKDRRFGKGSHSGEEGYCIRCEMVLALCGVENDWGETVVPANDEDGLCWRCVEEGYEPDGNGGWMTNGL